MAASSPGTHPEGQLCRDQSGELARTPAIVDGTGIGDLMLPVVRLGRAGCTAGHWFLAGWPTPVRCRSAHTVTNPLLARPRLPHARAGVGNVVEPPSRPRPRAARRLAGVDPRRGASSSADRGARIAMATVAAVSRRSSTQLPQWLLIVAIASGLISMHHLSLDAMPARESTATISISAGAGVAAVSETASGCGGERVRAVTAVAVSAPRGCSCMGDMVGHLCQAVLATASKIVPAMILLAAATQHAAPVLVGAASRALAARGPPTAGVRLSQLGVWRC